MSKINSKNITHWIIFCAIFFGILVRIYKFGQIPISLNRDEAALAYNAYTIARNGVDEWNRPYPFLFESFGDIKLPGYIYGTSMLMRIFKPDPWVVRLPTLMAGIGLLGLTYLIGKRLFSKKVALLATAVLSLSPWAVFYSRMAWEANVGLFWLLLSIYIFMISERWWLMGIAGLSLVLAILTYNTPLILVPVLVGFCMLLPRKTRRWKFGVCAMLGTIAVMFWVLFSPLTAQKQGITIFTDPTIKTLQMERYVEAENLFERIRDHQVTNWVSIMLVALIASFGPKFLVFNGGTHPWHSVPGRGHQMLTVYLGFIASFIFMIQDSWRRKRNWWAWWWLLTGSLLPAIITVDAPHATRSLLFLWIVGLLSVYVVDRYKKLLPFFTAGLVIEMVIFVQGYFIYMPQHTSPSWTRGLTEAVVEASRVTRGEIAVTNESGIGADLMAEQAYIYAAIGLVEAGESIIDIHAMGRNNAGLNLVDKVGRVLIINEPEFVPNGVVIIERDNKGNYELR